MKNVLKIITLILAVAIFAACLSACEKADVPELQGGENGGQTQSVKVSFYSDGTLYGIVLCTGNALAMPKDPEKQGHTFIGWFYDEDLNTPFVYEEFIAREDKTDISLYAAWEEIRFPDSGDGGEQQPSGGDDGEQQPSGGGEQQGGGDGTDPDPEVKTFTVVFTMDGQVVSTQKVEEGKDAVLPVSQFKAEGNALYALAVDGDYTDVREDVTVTLGWREADDMEKGIFALSYLTLLIKNGKLYVSDISEAYPFDYIVLSSEWGFFAISGIKDGAFARVPQIKSVMLGAYCTEIEWSAFDDLILLEKIRFDAENTSYSANGLFVTDAGGKELIAYLGADGGELVLPDGIVKIADGAFSGSGFTEITVPYGVTETGAGAFENCAELEEINLPDSVEIIGESAFENCVSLKELPVPAGVTYIGNRAFAGCRAATAVKYDAAAVQAIVSDNGIFDGAGADGGLALNVGKSVDRIPARLFDGSGAGKIYLEEIAFAADGALTSIGSLAFAATDVKYVTIPSTVTVIASGAFKDCASLVNVVYRAENALSQGISGTAFAGAGADGSVFTVGREVVSVPDYLLFSLGAKAGFSSLVFESGALEKIGAFAFAATEFCGDITLPSPVAEIGAGAFSQSAFCNISVEEDCAEYGSADGVLYTSDGEVLVAYPSGRQDKQYVVSDEVKEICAYAFAGALYLEKISISCARVGDFAFYNCAELSELNLAEGLTEIGTGAFSNSASLKSLVCPSTLKSIGENAFAYSALETVTLNEGLETLGSRAFAYCAALGEVTIPSSVTSVGEGIFDK